MVFTVPATIYEFGEVRCEFRHPHKVCLNESGGDILVVFAVVLRVYHPACDLLHQPLAHFLDALQYGHVGGDVEGTGVLVQPLENLWGAEWRMKRQRGGVSE